jgi:hypothetical protein
MPTFPAWIGPVLLAAGCLWVAFDVRSCVGKRAVAADTAKAAGLGKVAAKDESEGVTDVAKVKIDAGIVTTDDATDAGDDAAVAQDEAAMAYASPRHVPAPAGPKGDPQPVDVPLESPREGAKDRLITDLTKDLADTKSALLARDSVIKDQTAAIAAFQADADVKGQQVAALQAALSVVPRPLIWAAGAVYGTDGTIGAYVTRDLGFVQAGLDVVRHQRPSGPTTLEAVARLGIKF